jgi:hypothetical protein
MCAGCSIGNGGDNCEPEGCPSTTTTTTAATTTTTGTLPANLLSCDLHAYEHSPTGICIPYVAAGWDTALVRMVPQSEKDTTACPETAPYAGLTGIEITPDGSPGRFVLGCSVLPLATCESLSHVCVPFEKDYPACVLRVSQDDCPGGYSFVTTVAPHGAFAPTTVCCNPDEPPP